MTFLVNQPILQPENMLFSVLAPSCHKNEGKVVHIFNLEEVVSDMTILKGSSIFLPHVTFCAFTVVVVMIRVRQ